MSRDLRQLPKLRDSLTYLYVEKVRIEREENAVVLFDAEGRTNVPVAALSVLMLGPGVTISHAAVKLLAEVGCSIVWGGEDGMRFYAFGMGETRKAIHILRQAALMTDPAKRLEIVRKMYIKRFGLAENLNGLSLEQLRGREGIRVRQAYREAAARFKISWEGRSYNRESWNASSPVNRAISSANACLYSVCHAAIVSGGYSPALGFIHTGKQLSFVYDVADLYKVETTIPTAFMAISEGVEDIERRTRLMCRDAFYSVRLLDRILPDIDELFDLQIKERGSSVLDSDAVVPIPLWDAPLTIDKEYLENGCHDIRKCS